MKDTRIFTPTLQLWEAALEAEEESIHNQVH